MFLASFNRQLQPPLFGPGWPLVLHRLTSTSAARYGWGLSDPHVYHILQNVEKSRRPLRCDLCICRLICVGGSWSGRSGLTAGQQGVSVGTARSKVASHQMLDICTKFFMIVAIREFLCPGLSVTGFTQGSLAENHAPPNQSSQLTATMQEKGGKTW